MEPAKVPLNVFKASLSVFKSGLNVFQTGLNFFKTGVNGHFSNKEPFYIVTYTTTLVLFTVWAHGFLFDEDNVKDKIKKRFFKTLKCIPYFRKKIDEEIRKVEDNFAKSALKRTGDVKYLTQLPLDGFSDEQIINLLEDNLRLSDFDWAHGRVSGSVYYQNLPLIKLITEVYGKSAYTNPLHPDVFPGLCKMEAEIVRISTKLFNGDANCCGSVTSGGTESILMACKAYRDYARETRGVKRPEIVIPSTAHSAFDKAAQYFGLRVRSIKVDKDTLAVDIAAMKSAINRNTVMLAGSAPNFPYGTIDNIEQISHLGLSYNIPVHVDACLGGFLLAFMPQAGCATPKFDFTLKGVTSISADTHKYGFSPKGSSLVLYRDKKYHHHQFTVTTDWPGGVYGSPTISGSRAGGSIAVCWATLLHFGNSGYVAATKEILATTKYIEAELRKIDEIYIFGKPATSVIAIGSKVFDIYRLADHLSSAGWNLNILQFPSGIHICVTHLHTVPGVADQFLSDLHEGVDGIMKDPGVPVEGKMALYGVAQSLPDRSLVGDITRAFLDSMYYIPKA